MKIIEKENFNILQANIGYLLRDKNDVYKPAYIDENGNKVEEYKPYYFYKAYVPKTLTLEEAERIYEEEYDERSE